MANIKQADWKTESFSKFLERYEKALVKIRKDFPEYSDDKNLFFIPTNQLLTEMIGVHTCHWRRDFLAKGVKDGEQKLNLILNWNAGFETKLTNELIRRRDGYKYIKLLDMYYGTQAGADDLSLDENETVKNNITVNLNADSTIDFKGEKVKIEKEDGD